MGTIMPTHQCFDDVVDFFNEEVYRVLGFDAEECVVVHAMCILDGRRFAHAFIECGEYVVDAGLYDGVRIFFVTETMPVKIERACRYTLAEMIALDAKYGAGPWDPEVKELCARHDREGPRIIGAIEAHTTIGVRK